MQVKFNKLVGVDRVNEEIGNKNLMLRFEDYPAENIERVSYDVENQQFRLTVIPKPQMEPPKKNQVKVSYSGVSADTTILVGGDSADQFPALLSNELAETKLVHVGINDLSAAPGDKKIISLARPASSVSELFAEYVKELEGGFHPDIASNLLAGIHEGSASFSSRYTNADTFKLASELMQAGGKYTPLASIEKTRQFDFGRSGQSGPRIPVRPAAKSIPIDSPEEDTREAPQGETITPPKSWLQPKIYKGTSTS